MGKTKPEIHQWQIDFEDQKDELKTLLIGITA